jgi:hypothetical protein
MSGETRRRGVPTLLAVLALGLAGCGRRGNRRAQQRGNAPESESPTRPDNEQHATSAGGGFTGQAAANYDIARTACGAFPPRKVAEDLGLQVDGDTAVELGQIAGRDARGYTGRNRQGHLQGCHDGLPDPPKLGGRKIPPRALAV